MCRPEVGIAGLWIRDVEDRSGLAHRGDSLYGCSPSAKQPVAGLACSDTAARFTDTVGSRDELVGFDAGGEVLVACSGSASLTNVLELECREENTLEGLRVADRVQRLIQAGRILRSPSP